MSKSKQLYKNTALFSVSTLSTKLISILMVPLYTFVFSTAEFGIIEIIMTGITLVSPILVLSINDAVLRFSLSKQEDRPLIFSYGLLIGFVGTIASLLFLPVIKNISGVGDYAYFIIILVGLLSLYRIVSYFAMGIEKTRSFVISNFIVAALFALSNILFLILWKFKIDGYLISFVISNGIALFGLLYLIDGKQYLTTNIFKRENFALLKSMTVYSFPLITNSLMWWVTNASDRFIVFCLLGSSFTGIYAVANKIPIVLSSTIGIFNQAWQLSAIKEFDSQDKNEFYTHIYVRLFSVILVLSSLLIASLKIILKVFVSDEYYLAWQSAQFLILAAGLSVIASFLGANYVAAKENLGNMLSTILGAVVNIGLNFLLIPVFNLRGAAFSTFISYALVVAYRLWDTKKYVEINWANRKIFFSFALTLFQICLLELDSYLFDIASMLLSVLILIINKFLVIEVYQLIKSKLPRACEV